MDDRDGNTGFKDAKNRIKIYAKKNSGIEIVVSVVAFTALSKMEFLNNAVAIPNKRDSGTAIIAVIEAKNNVFQRRGAIKDTTERDRSIPDAERPEKEVPKSPDDIFTIQSK